MYSVMRSAKSKVDDLIFPAYIYEVQHLEIWRVDRAWPHIIVVEKARHADMIIDQEPWECRQREREK